MVGTTNDRLTAIESRLAGIENRVGSIQTILEKGQKTALYQFIYVIGLTSMVAGMSLVTTTSYIGAGLTIFLIGLLLSIIAPFLSRRRG